MPTDVSFLSFSPILLSLIVSSPTLHGRVTNLKFQKHWCTTQFVCQSLLACTRTSIWHNRNHFPAPSENGNHCVCTTQSIFSTYFLMFFSSWSCCGFVFCCSNCWNCFRNTWAPFVHKFNVYVQSRFAFEQKYCLSVWTFVCSEFQWANFFFFFKKVKAFEHTVPTIELTGFGCIF